MDLQISVFLLFVLFTAGHTLRCFKCLSTNGNCANQTEETCTNGAYCMSQTSVSRDGNDTLKRCTFDCHHGSMNTGTFKMTSFCCSTDLCNSKDAPDDINIPNGRKCFSCDGQNCTNILNCSGSEDRCFKDEGTSGNSSFVKGCISKSVCDTLPVYNVTVRRCCEGNLCNGVANTSFTQNTTDSFLFFCCSLLYFLLQ